MDLAIISLIVSVIMMLVGVIGAFSAYKERHAKSSAEQAKIAIKIDTLTTKITKMDADLLAATKGYHDNHEKITVLETKVKSLEARVKALEESIKKINEDIKNYHTH